VNVELPATGVETFKDNTTTLSKRQPPVIRRRGAVFRGKGRC